MNKREQILGIAALSAVGLFGGWFVAQRVIVAPFAAQRKAIAAAQSDIYKLEKRRDVELVNVRRDWRLLTNRTLAKSPEDAQDRFREDINGLLSKHGFDQKQVTVKSDALPRKRTGIVETGLQITTKGRLKETVDLLLDLAQRDYLLRLDTVTLNSERPAGGKAGKTLDPKGPELTINIHCSTLVVPELQKIAHEPATEIRAATEGKLPRPLDEYARIAKQNVFAEFVPPPPITQRPITPETPIASTSDPQPGGETIEQPPPPVVDPRADASHFRLTGTGSLRGSPAAWIRDDRTTDATSPAAEITLNAPLDDGVLVLVHPRGIVIRSTQGADAGRDFFYPIGALFTERVPVDATLHADVAADLKIALRQ